jgi:formyl-CoA transferase
MRVSPQSTSTAVRRSPLVGEHNQQYPLGTELGISESEMAELKASGVI